MGGDGIDESIADVLASVEAPIRKIPELSSGLALLYDFFFRSSVA